MGADKNTPIGECGKCLFFHLILDYRTDDTHYREGECRRHAPVTKWPQVSYTDFCGDWSQKTEEDQEC